MYPIRTNRPSWCFPFTKPHTCSELCTTQYEIQSSEVRVIYDAGCIYPENIEPAVYSFTGQSNDEVDVQIHLPNRGKMKVYINYPLKKPTVRNVDFGGDSIELSRVLQMFKQFYEEIYEEEEAKSSYKKFTYHKRCTQCLEDDTLSISQFCICKEEEEVDCNICFDNVHSQTNPLVHGSSCKHIFHRNCLLRWINTQKPNSDFLEFDSSEDTEARVTQKNNSCPVCRQVIFTCSKCQNTYQYEVQYEGAVIPFDPDNGTTRNDTDGPYGIHSLYFEELLFKGIFIQRDTATISLLPFERLC